METIQLRRNGDFSEMRNLKNSKTKTMKKGHSDNFKLPLEFLKNDCRNLKVLEDKV